MYINLYGNTRFLIISIILKNIGVKNFNLFQEITWIV